MKTKIYTDKEKILQYLDYKSISKNKFYKKTGLSIGFLDSGSSLGVDKLRKIIDNYPDFNPDWLLTGTGEMIKSKQNSLSQNIIGNENYMAGKDIVIDKENKVLNDEIKALKAQIIEKDLIIKTLVEQQKKLINKL